MTKDKHAREDSFLTRSRSRTLARACWGAVLRGSLLVAPPVFLLLGIGDRTGALLCVAASLPGLALFAERSARQAATRFERFTAALTSGTDTGALSAAQVGRAMFESLQDAEDLTLQMAAGARRVAELAQVERSSALERERLTADGMAALFMRRVYAEERAMAVLAAELHDTVAQELAVALITAEDGAPVAEVVDSVRRAERQLRGVLALASPPELAGGLAQALEALLAELHLQFGLVVNVASWPDEPLAIPRAAATTTYRFLQESLRNVVKHSGQDKAVVHLSITPHELHATVQDNGKGFDASTVRPSAGRHVGLFLLDDRARAVGGRLSIHAKPDEGATVKLVVPLDTLTGA